MCQGREANPKSTPLGATLVGEIHVLSEILEAGEMRGLRSEIQTFFTCTRLCSPLYSIGFSLLTFQVEKIDENNFY